tara:strand:+ start:1616 stop:1915 length:300 start_codon:yes stop_codon:yes gene_type:complete
MKNVQLLRLVSGEELLSDVDLNGIDTDTVILKDTLCLIPAGEGKIGFMPFMPYTKAKDGLELDMKHIMFMVEPNDMLLEQHRNATSELAVPPEKKIVTS